MTNKLILVLQNGNCGISPIVEMDDLVLSLHRAKEKEGKLLVNVIKYRWGKSGMMKMDVNQLMKFVGDFVQSE